VPVVRRIRNRGANITVEANAEVLFMPGGQVHNWANRFTGRIRSATIAEAPTNKRPRWDHYGKPLKATIVSARPRFWGNGRDKQRVYGAVGSTAPHAYYVDQGTGVYAGNGPYEAKVLPPWQRGSASLYEATWRPGGIGTRKVSPVMIRGQRGQFFFDKGLKRAFQSMRLRSFQVPGDPTISGVLNSMPTGMLDFLGNTPADAGFRASLAEWRSWRDEVWDKGGGLGRGGGVGSRAHAKYVEQAMVDKQRAKKKAAVKPKPAAKAKSTAKPKQAPAAKATRKVTRAEAAHLQRMAALRSEERTLIEAIRGQFPGARILDLRHGMSDGVPYWFFSIQRKGVTTNHKNRSAIA
jgi:hypothetical protein